MILNKTFSSQLCLDCVKQNKSQVSLHPSCRKTTKVPCKMSVGHASVTAENPECYLRPLLKNQTSFETDLFPSIIVTPWRTHKSTRGPMCNPTPRALNQPQTVKIYTFFLARFKIILILSFFFCVSYLPDLNLTLAMFYFLLSPKIYLLIYS
jgi:hypothetical protein